MQSVVSTVTKPPDGFGRSMLMRFSWMESAVCALLAVLLVWKGILPGWRFLNTDFPNYYLVGRLLREGYALDRIYDWVWLQRIKDHWGLDQPLVGFAGLTPFSALPVLPLTFFSALVAKRLWILINLLLLAGTPELLHRITTLGRRRLWLLTLLAVFPLRTSFLLGQMHLLVLILFAAAYFFHRRGKFIACGFCLGIAGLLKVYPLLFGFYFLWKRQWKSVAALLGCLLCLLGLSYLWIGKDAIYIYVTQVLPRSLQGEILDPYAQIASASALFHRLLIFEPALNPAPLAEAPGLFAVLYPLWQLAVILPLLALLQERASTDTEQVEWAAWLLALLVLSPVPASYHFVVMIFSAVLLIDRLLAWHKWSSALLAGGLYFAICIVDLVPRPIQSSMPVLFSLFHLSLEIALLLVCFYVLWQSRPDRRLFHISSGRIAGLATVAAAVWCVGVLSWRHHFVHLEAEMAHRMQTAPSAYLSTGYRSTAEGYAVTAMTADGYSVLDQNGQALWSAPDDRHPHSDQLSAAVTPSGPGALIEVADTTGSAVVALSAAERGTGLVSSRRLIGDAESPAISAGGTAVAFIRETKGRGTLWFGHLDRPMGQWRSAPYAVTDPSYDVRDVAFSSAGWMLFTARVKGHTRLFSLVPGSDPQIFLAGSEDVDSPAISADDRFIVFRKLMQGHWQLGTMEVATGRQRMLTFGDCNAYSPAWAAPATIAYATDCGRGLGLSALSRMRVHREAMIPGDQ